ncbi:hypothetical protein DU500_17230 (plasmid) [Haloplanus rubicundus]|uniref:Uncharacterized protein n=1 Tax=Haloplanus rubicundus TaxID=1547898 RepID=A0A345E7R3_9EURY|nr:hypothetical protein DU500_17230 [Haloplanus rubicundus]
MFDRLHLVGTNAEIEIEPLCGLGLVDQKFEGVVRAHEREASLDVERECVTTSRTVESVEPLDDVIGGNLLTSRGDLDVRSWTLTVRVISRMFLRL